MKTLSQFVISAALSATSSGIPDAAASPPAAQVAYRTETIDGISIFYREAGPSNAPTVVLLHGFPSSSHMFRNLIPKLAVHYHVIAPDYPGFGYSDAPPADIFDATFESLTTVMEHFLQHKGQTKVSLYLQDFGGPVGFRIAVHHPEWIRSLIIQNANAYEVGLAEQIRQGSAARTTHPTPVNEMAFELGSGLTDLLYKQGVRNPEHLSPDAWHFDLWAMEQPGHQRIGAALINDYHTNIEAYPQWQEYFRQYQPPTLVVWGRGDPIFLPSGAEAYKTDLKNVRVRFFATSHFALEEDGDGIAAEALEFLKTTSPSRSIRSQLAAGSRAIS
jgi:pimeloyl-ACP methyl ester carboxylesterase